MNHEIQNLIVEANSIIDQTGRGTGIRYPQSLKDIISILRNKHELSAREIKDHTGISTYSAREWPKIKEKKTKKVFNKINISQGFAPPKKVNSQNVNYYNELNLIIFNLKVLINLIVLLIFLILFLHLIS